MVGEGYRVEVDSGTWSLRDVAPRLDVTRFRKDKRPLYAQERVDFYQLTSDRDLIPLPDTTLVREVRNAAIVFRRLPVIQPPPVVIDSAKK